MDKDRSHELANSIPFLLFTFDANGIIIETNAHAADLLEGIDRIRVDEIIHIPKDSFLDKLLKGNQPGDGFGEFYSRFAAEVGYRTIYCLCGKLDTPKHHHTYYLVVRILSENSLTKDMQLRSIVLAEELERSRIFKDLHDSVGQQLTALRFYLKKNMLDVEGGEISLEECRSVIDDAIQDLREVCFRVMPASLDCSGCIEAVDELVQRMDRISGMDISFDVDGNPEKLPEHLNVTIYRIVQESLSNIMKHSKASKGEISLSMKDSVVELCIQDNGIGIPSNALSGKGHGLKNLVSRIEAQQGELHVDSHKEKGTELKIRFPVKPHR